MVAKKSLFESEIHILDGKLKWRPRQESNL